MTAFDREEQSLEEQLFQGNISICEFNKEMRELQRDYRAEAIESAENAYQQEINNW